MMIVILEWPEYAMGVNNAVLKAMGAIRRGYKNNHGMVGIGWEEGIEGTLAEIAVAKALGIFWNGGVGEFKGPDVGTNIQVRWTNKATNKLIVRDADRSENTYVLVTGECPEYNIVGWIEGTEAKQDRFLFGPNGRPPAYFVPQEELNPIESLIYNDNHKNNNA
jgi:hypothetical protein